MAPPTRRSQKALPPPATIIGADGVDDATLSAALRHFAIDRADALAITVGDDRVVLVTVDGRKLVWEA